MNANKETDYSLGVEMIPLSMGEFFEEIDHIRDAIRQIEDNVGRIEMLHQQSLQEVDESNIAATTRQLEGFTADTRRLQTSVQLAIRSLESQNMQLPPDNDTATRKTQTEAVKKKFMDQIRHFLQIEKTYRAQYEQRMRRQLEIANPRATEEDFQTAISEENGGQVFAQALLRSNRSGEARTALREVQERHADIKKIERTIAELAQLFQDMATMVQEQEPAVDKIVTDAVNVRTNMGEGTQHMDRAIKSARDARRKKWICFGVCILIVCILVAVLCGVLIPVVGNHNKH
ncbi:plasma membrane SNARE Psy1 [Schizosaccharomyces osmophilus]|uniref:Plasma membrane SNARE Psy1 n=1 Tax=Schizosaccharomyces osmophilus TaxID=2545709 RepID=A0AAF0AY14_9SCHI|nr:plasma membrane SNARE Psy1 [Schizosaccharomyces osmophilus]WBW74555.1 plasma membrane SNARE Psy1 [Schizosaccharomyces osmophilus]